MQKNELVTITCIDYDSEGLGMGKTEDGFCVFVKDLILGETAEVQLINVKKNYGYGRAMKRLNDAPGRVIPTCPIAYQCGGCQIQHMSAETQAEFKQSRVENVMKRIAKTDCTVNPIITMATPWNYRNKVQVPFAIDKNGLLISGFYRAHSHDILPFSDCFLQPSEQNNILKYILDFYNSRELKPEMLKTVLLKKAFATDECMVVLITNTWDLTQRKQLVEGLLETFPNIKSVVQNLNNRNDNVLLGNEDRCLTTQSTITDQLGDFKFQISSKSFYQVNPIQAKVLYDLAAEFAELKETDTVMDLFSGIGTIAIWVSRKVKEVLGVEILPQAIQDAKANAAINHIENITWFNGDAAGISAQLSEENKKIDVIIVDPPRKGLDESTIESIAAIQAERLVYISCDPATLARDINLLQTKGYTVKKIQPVDMFPQTYHVETVVLMTKVKE